MIVGRRFPRETLYLPLLGLVYFAAAAATVGLTRFGGGVAFIWLASAPLLSWLSLVPRERWLAPLIMCAVASCSATALFGLGLAAAPGMALANTAEAVLAATLLKRWIDKPGCFESLGEVGWFMLAVGVLAPAASAPLGAAFASVASGTSFAVNVLHWFAGHALGGLTVAPLLLLAGRGEFAAWRRGATLASGVEAGALLAALTATVVLVFGQTALPLLFLPFLPALVVTFRIGRLGAAASMLILIAVGVPMTLAGLGPIALIAGAPALKAQFFQFYIAIAVCMVLPAAGELKRRKRLYAALCESESRYRLLADRSSDIILNVAIDGAILYASPSLETIGGFAPDSVLGRHARAIVHEDDLEMVTRSHRQALAAPDETITVEYRAPMIGDEQRWFEAYTRAVLDEHGHASGVVSAIRDVTHRRAREDMLSREAATDPLTGLANRRTFMDALERRIAELPAGGSGASVAVIDLDHFKAINDRHGHATGDAVLVAIARAIEATLREGDLVARLGGEEFGLLLAKADRSGAQLVCERIRARVAALDLQSRAGAPVRVTMSAGLKEIEADASAPELLEAADRALYAAKREGRNRVALAA